jgi:hypothetical protein
MRRTFTIVMVFLCMPVLTSAQSASKLPAPSSIEQAIDHYIDARLKEEKINAAPPADDAAILRRLMLDLNGRVPTLAEMDAYLASNAPDKKTKLVDRLLASPAFPRHQAQQFHAFMANQDGTRRRGDKGNPLYDYLLMSFNENRSWERVFREMMLPAETDPKMKGASDFLKSRIKDLNKATIDVSTTFFGVNVSCAQCHDHPHVSSWTQDQFYGMKSFFARTVDVGGFLGEKDFGVVKYTPNKGKEKVAPILFLSGRALDVPGMKEATGEEKKKEQARLATEKKVKGKAPAAKAPPEPPQFSLRGKLVETALAPANRDYFARNIVNRLWHRLYGRGLVMPLDQMHSENAASHPELLDWLARDMADHGYDVRRMIRGMVLSEAYARDSRWDSEQLPDDKLFAVAQVRPLAPMQFAVALKLASADPQAMPAEGKELEKRLAMIEKGAGNLAALFVQPGDNFQVGVAEAMLFANNKTVQKELLEGDAALPARLMKETDLQKRADLAVRSVLNRPARQEEVQALVGYMQRRQDRQVAACQQIVWALMTSAEFRFNH